MILDTNAISALLEGNKQLGKILGRGVRHQLPLIAIAEYLFGLRSSTKGSKLRSVFRRLEADCEVLYPDRVTADQYVAIRSELTRQGQPIPEGDIWIAALARQHALEIITRDQHFDLVAGVKRLDW
jgi:tRNA(fMet)-specific endonuclease VapC